MKYSKSYVMKKAWEIKRKSGKNLSESLKMAWNFTKAIVEIKEKEKKEDGTVWISFWFNYGKARAYIERSWYAKYQNGKGYFIDLTNGDLRLK